MVIPPIATHAPPKILAKQWLQAYQYATAFVPPLILSGAISNALLAYFANSWGLKILYASAAVLILSIVPVTLLWFEPGINGAGKWKVQQVLRDEGFVMRRTRD
jgi:membrane protein YdbS with pleckstrin-like domain